ncbi:MAG TPA: M28 family peptidase [Gemmatimonadaceae bacterium]|nr:M28 family peptidase [Gemmatimonadaceae bacterium]
MSPARHAAALVSGALLATLAACTAKTSGTLVTPQDELVPQAGALPLKLAPRPTVAAITPADLMTRLYIFADDSMMGRQVGTEYNLKGTAYIEREVRRMGLVPAGTDGYYQNIPLFTYFADSASVVRIAGQALAPGTDYLVFPQREQRIALEGLPVVLGGSAADSATWISAEAATGKLVVLTVPAATSNPVRVFGGASRFARAAALVVVSLDRLAPNVRRFIARRTALASATAPAAGPPSVFVTPRVAGLLFGAPIEGVAPGTTGRSMEGALVLRQAQAPGRNVIAILTGSDPVLRNEYVAIGAHNDHIGFNTTPVDHDSIRAFNAVARVQGADSPRPGSLTAEQSTRIRAMTDSLHALHGTRRDSIYNGADDDGSGSMSVLEIAQALASSPTKPKRSILFVWHTGEEAGLWGAEHFTDHPTVPRESIVAQLNMDMVGRGAPTDVTGELKEGGLARGAPGYLQLIGSRRLSTELGDLVDAVNRAKGLGLVFDYSQDANGHPQNIYCRSDHYEYARYGIPIVFFTTGGHADYHQVTDEPQYMDYGRMAQVATLVHEVAVTVANLDHRLLVDKPRPDPRGRCVQ